MRGEETKIGVAMEDEATVKLIHEVIDKIRSRNTEMISDEDAATVAFPERGKK